MTELQKYCGHKWVVYTGLMSSFEHCETCGLKKSEYKEPEIDPNDYHKPYGFLKEFHPGGIGWGADIIFQGKGKLTPRYGFNSKGEVIEIE